MIYKFVAALDKRFGFEHAKAHCDVPCGIYDPSGALIAALTVVRMMDLIADLESKGGDKNAAYFNTLSRYITVKEEHAEKAKAEVRIIWGDYIKAQHLEKHMNVHDRETAVQLVEAINQFAEIFWETKGIATKRAKAPYAPALEVVYPVL
jgi:nickel superoxide dismutase